ncbi:hypothetical protein SALBM311S_11923 [Streptomyces alboniger]
MSKVILVTGAGRGLGTDIAREALDAGHQVVATGRRPDEVEKTLGGPQDNLLVTRLDVTSPEDAQAAAQAAVDRFGRIDVLVNNAGNLFTGYFEEISPAQMRQQFETNLFGTNRAGAAADPRRDIACPEPAGLSASTAEPPRRRTGRDRAHPRLARRLNKLTPAGWAESRRYDEEPSTWPAGRGPG